ncbi:MAG: hypothetical protein Q7J22_00520 [Candidatus Wolfebacteria bacterium]|nr:hypothetical protein [Candidatus Wolfebacteria bacterium]MDP2704678.1 hypothetical protein [bacterium]
MNRYFLQAVGVLAGTAMGAGVFSLPYVFSKVGLLLGFVFLGLFTLVYFGIHSMYARILLKSERPHDFFYAAERYLPRAIARPAAFLIIAELLFSLLVYLVLAPAFAELLFGVSSIWTVLGFWALGSLFIFLGLSEQSWAGFLGVLVMAGIIFVVLGASAGGSLTTPVVLDINPFLFFLPFGPILFSLAARSALPEVIALYRGALKAGQRFSLPLVLFLGTAVPALVYGIFVIGILRLDFAPPPEALGGLMVSPTLLRFLGAFGLIAIWTSYFVIGRNVRDNLHFDLGISKIVSGAVALFFPLVLFALGFREFLEVVSFAGGFFLALEGVFVLMMWGRAFPESRWLWVRAPLYIIFLCAIGYQVVSLVTRS